MLLLSACSYFTQPTEETIIDYELIESEVKNRVSSGIVTVNDFVFGIIVNKSGNTYKAVAGYNSIGNRSTHKIKDYNSNEYDATLVKSSESSYLAMFQFTSSSNDLTVLQLTQTSPEVISNILTIGSNNAVNFGTAYEEKFNSSMNAILFSHNAQSTTLNSSSIVFDYDGIVVGIEIASSMLSTNGRTTRFGVYSSRIRSFL